MRGTKDAVVRRAKKFWNVVLISALVLIGASQALAAQSVTYVYDAANNITAKTVDGLRTEYGSYDTNGNPGYKIEAAGTAKARRTDYTYDPRFHHRVATRSEPSVYPGGQKVTTFSYDVYGNVTDIHITGYTPAGTAVMRSFTLQYDGPLHQLSQIDGPRTDVTDVTTVAYYPNDPAQGNNRARVQRVTSPLGIVLRDNIQYTSTGQIASESRLNGLILSYTYYSGSDRLETLTESDGSASRTLRWTYLATGEINTITLADGAAAATTITLIYDDARRLTGITDGLGNSIEYTLDTEGNAVAEQTHNSGGVLYRAIARTFDAYNRVSRITQANELHQYAFAANGTLSQDTGGNGATTQYTYDELNRLKQVTGNAGGANVATADVLTQYGYDVGDRLVQVTDPNGATTTYTYDDLGDRLSRSSPDSGTMSYTYDAAGNVASLTDAKGQTTSYAHDALNRITSTDAPGTADDITYTYDNCANGVGHLCSVTRGSVTTTYAYNGFGEMIVHQGMSYAYDSAGRVTQLTYPSGAIITYLYDSAGRVRDVQLTTVAGTQSLASNITHAPFDRVQGLTYGNGISLSQTFDAASRLRTQDAGAAFSWHYDQYDANGNLTTRTDTLTASSDQFGYDALDRLTSAGGAFGVRSYQYDKNDNRTQAVRDGVTIPYGYTPTSNRLNQVDATSVTLDANGNTIAQGTRNFIYTADNRLREVDDGGVTLVNYVYNGLGQRISKQTGGQSVQYAYDLDGHLIAELDAQGVPRTEYVYLDGQPLAMLVQEGGAANNGIYRYSGTVTSAGVTAEVRLILDTVAKTLTYQRPGGALAGTGVPAARTFDISSSLRVDTAQSPPFASFFFNVDGVAAGQGGITLDTATGQTNASINWSPPRSGSYPATGNPGQVAFNATDTRTGLTATYQLDLANHKLTLNEQNGFIGTYAIPAASWSESTYNTTAGTVHSVYSSFTISAQQSQSISLNWTDYPDHTDARVQTFDGPTVMERLQLPAQPTASTTTVYYAHDDALGTPQRLTNAGGQVVWSAQYDPFGAATVNEDPDGDGQKVVLNLRLPGQYYDLETGLHYNYYRYYDPSTGRYITSDPIGLDGGINTYLYVSANPFGGIDPLGLFEVYGYQNRGAGDGWQPQFQISFHPINDPNSTASKLFKAIRWANKLVEFLDTEPVGPKHPIKDYVKCGLLDNKLEREYEGLFGYTGRLNKEDALSFLNKMWLKYPEMRKMYPIPSEIIDQAEKNSKDNWYYKLRPNW